MITSKIIIITKNSRKNNRNGYSCSSVKFELWKIFAISFESNHKDLLGLHYEKLQIPTARELNKTMTLTRNKLLRHSKKYGQLDDPRYRLNPFPVQLGATNQLPVPAATMGYLLLVILFRLLFFQEWKDWNKTSLRNFRLQWRSQCREQIDKIQNLSIHTFKGPTQVSWILG